MHLSFTAHGVPTSQGSVTAYPTKGGRGVRVVSKTPKLVEWREIVRHAAELAAGEAWETQDGAALVHITFYLDRPKTAPKTRDVLPKKKEDLDKLVRAIFDAVTSAGIWTDDSRATGLTTFKFFAVGPDLPKIYDPEKHRVSPRVEVQITWLNEDSATG